MHRAVSSALAATAAGAASSADHDPVGAEPLFCGKSIFTRLAESTFGAFSRAMASIQLPAVDTFSLPRVVVIGCEKSGKSTLLEAITKCAIFPRAEGLATRMPVRLELSASDREEIRIIDNGREKVARTSGELLAAVSSAMTALGDGIVDRELVIKISRPGLPRLTLVDLPGIREVSESLRAASKRLTEKYVSDPNTVVLCVVSATKTLQTDQALGLVSDLGAGDRTILVLTMCDLVVSKQWESRVFKPLLGETEALAICDLRGCFGVVNRALDDSGRDTDRLVDAHTREERWLQEMLTSVRRPDAEAHNRIVAHLSVGNLVKEIDVLFNEHICDVWQPSASAMLDTYVATTVTPKLDALGPVAPALSPALLIKEVLTRSLASWDRRVGKVDPFPKQPTGVFGTATWMQEQAAFEAKFKQVIQSGAVFDVFLAEALRALDEAFTAPPVEVAPVAYYGHPVGCSCYNCNSQRSQVYAAPVPSDKLRLMRFSTAQASVKRRFKDAFLALKAAETTRVSAIATHGATASVVSSWVLSSCVWPSFEAVRSTPTDAALLTEDAASAGERQKLMSLVTTTDSARVVVAGLHKALGASSRRLTVVTKW